MVFFQIQSLFSFIWPYARPETNIFVVVNRYDNTILFWHKIHFKQAANNLLFLKMGLSLITADQNVLNKYFWFKPFPIFRRRQLVTVLIISPTTFADILKSGSQLKPDNQFLEIENTDKTRIYK